jgi:hypothetical protein
MCPGVGWGTWAKAFIGVQSPGPAFTQAGFHEGLMVTTQELHWFRLWVMATATWLGPFGVCGQRDESRMATASWLDPCGPGWALAGCVAEGRV